MVGFQSGRHELGAGRGVGENRLAHCGRGYQKSSFKLLDTVHIQMICLDQTPLPSYPLPHLLNPFLLLLKTHTFLKRFRDPDRMLGTRGVGDLVSTHSPHRGGRRPWQFLQSGGWTPVTRFLAAVRHPAGDWPQREPHRAQPAGCTATLLDE